MLRVLALGVLACATCWPAPVRAQTSSAEEGPRHIDTSRPKGALDLAAARTLALAQNPRYLAATMQMQAFRGDLQSARTYAFNPVVEVEGPGSLTDGSVGRYEVRLAQEIEWGGQQGLRTEAAEAALGVAGHELSEAARTLLADVERAYYRLAAAEQRSELAREIEALNTRLLEAVRIQLSEGEVSVLQANLVDIEAARARARVLDLDRSLSSARIELNRLLGLPADSAIAVDPSSLATPSLPEAGDSLSLRVALTSRPDLAAARHTETQANVLRRLASREALPNLGIQGIAEREHSGAGARFGVGFALPLPLFDRNQGLRARRLAEAREAELLAEAAEQRVRADVADALAAFRTSDRELEIYRQSVLSPARANQPLLETAYREGKLDLSSLLLLRNQLLDAELGFWDAWERQRSAAVALRSATASILPAPPSRLEESR